MPKGCLPTATVAPWVFGKLATSDKVTLTIERMPEGKMCVTSQSWDNERAFAPDQVLEVRWVDGRLHVARKDRHHDEWDRPVEAYVRLAHFIRDACPRQPHELGERRVRPARAAGQRGYGA
jgi:hypothetical protein